MAMVRSDAPQCSEWTYPCRLWTIWHSLPLSPCSRRDHYEAQGVVHSWPSNQCYHSKIHHAGSHSGPCSWTAQDFQMFWGTYMSLACWHAQCTNIVNHDQIIEICLLVLWQCTQLVSSQRDTHSCKTPCWCGQQVREGILLTCLCYEVAWRATKGAYMI